MKKLLMFTVIVLTGLLFMPLTHATGLGTVKIADNKDSVQDGTKPNITGENSSNVTITYEAANLKIVDQNSGGVDRKTDAAWVGFIITTPTDASNNTKKVEINGKEYDADQKGEYYFAITKDKLDKGEPIVYTCKFDWDYQNETFTTDQTVTITINPAVVKLVEKDSTKVVYDGPAKAKEQENQKQEENKENTENSTDNTKNPNTADSIYLWLGILAISGIGLGYFVKKLN